MVRYPAISVGVLVRSLPDLGRKAVVYPRAINFTGPDGLVLSLVAGLSAMSAHSVRVPELFTRRRAELQGETVCGERDRLIVGGRVAIELAGAEPWSGLLPVRAGRGFTPETLELLRESLLRLGRPGGFLGLLAPGSGGPADNPFVGRAAAVLGELSVRERIGGLGRLVGLGPGLTPSGDDFLTGALLGEQVLLRGRHPSEGPGIDRSELEAALDRTSPPGRNLLWLALRGHFPAYLLELVERIDERPRLEAVEEAVRGVIAHGETSGTDSAAGLVWYLEGVAWRKKDDRRISSWSTA